MNIIQKRIRHTLTDREEIRQVMAEGALHGTAITVQLKGDEQIYHSAFETRDEEELQLVRRGQGLLIAPLDPPVGNIKMRFSPQVTLRFALHDHAVEVESQLERLLEQRVVRMRFPHQATLSAQQRNNDRIPVLPDHPVEMDVSAESGPTLEARIYDISRGGLAFYAVEQGAPLLPLGKVRITLWLAPFPEVALQAELLGTKQVGNRLCYRAIFRFRTSRERTTQAFMVAHLDKSLKQRRQELFGNAPPVVQAAAMGVSLHDA